MKVLLIGGGGREAAIAASLKKSKHVDELYCAPGNAGIAKIATCVPIGVMEFDKLIAFAKEKAIDLAVCSQDDPLCAGIVDAFEAAGLKIFGTRKNAAIIEGSKAFSKQLMKKYGIPTAAYEIFTDADRAEEYLKKEVSFPIVLKASGLALGKGVLICQNLQEALDGVKEIMLDRKFGAAGAELVIEEFMTGREVSALAFCDGKSYQLMSSSQDHKRIGDGDTGLNTGGMGTFSPSPFYTKEIDQICRETIYQKTIDAMAAEGRPFTGVLYFGLMLTKDGPKVVEYNTRFGDPETQVILPRLQNDLVDVMLACAEQRLDEVELSWRDDWAVSVVLTSAGYPGSYEKGKVITGIEDAEALDGVTVYHAGSREQDGQILPNGGRVIDVTALGATFEEARNLAYAACEKIDFEGKTLRHDIGLRALKGRSAWDA